MKRIFIESQDLDESEVRRANRTLRRTLNVETKNFFDEIVDFAEDKIKEAWEAVKSADEIYADSSLVPYSGYGSYDGSPLVFDTMMENAIKEGITGKSIYFLREKEDIEWENIDLELLDKAFKNNFLYTFEDNTNFEQVDIDGLLKKYK